MFTAMTLAMQSAAKNEARTYLASYIRDNVKRPKVLTLPGTQWYFEKILKPVKAYGIERSVGIAAAANRCSPDRNWRVRCMTMKEYLLEQLVADKFDDWNCAWLDFCGPMSIEIRDTLRAMNLNLRMRGPGIPVGVTIMLGREQKAGKSILRTSGPDLTRSRVLTVRNELGIEIDDAWTYRSTTEFSNGAAMMLMYGKSKR